MQELDIFFKQISAAVDDEIDRLIESAHYSPPNLNDAMRWSLFAGGKRFRPSLVFAGGRAFGVGDRKLIPMAAAVEMLHTYSLIHDDLPSMDDDDLRRGRETCHRKFGESTAILAGDALQAKAFQTIAQDGGLSESVRILLIAGLGDAAARMVAGQQLDLEAEGKELSIADVKKIHSNKTGALISFSVEAGAVIGGATGDELSAMKQYGDHIGLLFQITDDILDLSGTTASLGKTAGKDIESDKATYPKIIGIKGAEELAKGKAEDARRALSRVGRDTSILIAMIEYLIERRS